MNRLEQHDDLYLGKEHTDSYAAWNRPHSALEYQEEELMQHSARALLGTSDPVERLRLLCLSRGATGIMGLGRVFRRMDRDGSKQLNKKSFVMALKKTGLILNDEEVEQLFNTFDVDKQGFVHIEDFLNHVRPPMSNLRQAMVDHAFQKMDKSCDGVITLDELRNTYNVKSHPRYMSGEETAELILDKFIESFEQQCSLDGQVTLNEFMDYYSGISVSVDTDCYFDLMIRQEYNL